MNMKVINDLLGYKELKIVQNTDWFSFSLDSILLPNFVSIAGKSLNILDIGTGNAPIPLILSTKTNSKIYGFEIQKEVYEKAKESIDINNLNNKITIINDDIKNIGNYFKNENFDIILTNPPYFKLNSTSHLNETETKAIARHEIKLTLEETMEISFKYLKNNGVFAIVHRTERLVEILSLMTKHRLEPKRIRFVYPRRGAISNIVLVEGVKNANPGIKCVDPLFVHNLDGSYTDAVKKFFQ